MQKSTPPAHPETTLAHSHEALRTWLKIITCHNLVETELRNLLRVQFDTTLPRFDLMAQLQRYPDGLRMSELSQNMMVTGGNVTGLVERLVSEGLVAREEDPVDRRAYRVSLTEQGRNAFTAMAAEHERWLQALFAGLSTDELVLLSGLLGKLKNSVTAKQG